MSFMVSFKAAIQHDEWMTPGKVNRSCSCGMKNLSYQLQDVLRPRRIGFGKSVENA